MVDFHGVLRPGQDGDQRWQKSRFVLVPRWQHYTNSVYNKCPVCKCLETKGNKTMGFVQRRVKQIIEDCDGHALWGACLAPTCFGLGRCQLKTVAFKVLGWNKRVHRRMMQRRRGFDRASDLPGRYEFLLPLRA